MRPVDTWRLIPGAKDRIRIWPVTDLMVGELWYLTWFEEQRWHTQTAFTLDDARADAEHILARRQ